MNDVEYMLKQDIIEKKQAGRAVRYHNLTGKGAVRMPSDYMSKKEIESMNGDVKVYNLKQPMSREEFNSLDEDKQREYIKYLDDTYAPTNQMLSDLFGTSRGYISTLRQRLGISTLRSVGGGKEILRPQKKKFYAWLHWGQQENPEENSVKCAEFLESREDSSVVGEISDTDNALNQSPNFYVSVADFTVCATPNELETMLKLLFGQERRVYRIVVEEG